MERRASRGNKACLLRSRLLEMIFSQRADSPANGAASARLTEMARLAVWLRTELTSRPRLPALLPRSVAACPSAGLPSARQSLLHFAVRDRFIVCNS
jgi:hypothetical protein